MIPIFVEGTMNVFKHYGVIPGAIGRTAVDANVYIGKSAGSRADHPRWLHRIAGQAEGQGHAGTSWPFSATLSAKWLPSTPARSTALSAACAPTPMSEPGNVLFFILADAAPVTGSAPYSE